MKRPDLLWILLLVWLLAACQAIPVEEEQATATTPSLQPTATATAIPTVEATPREPQNLTLWLPDVLTVSGGGEESGDLLSQQIAAFSDAGEGITVEIRRKQVREAGGIIPTLRTAKNVAPGVLPDLTLIRREDLVEAVDSDLLQPMEGVVSSAVIGDLFSTALEVGQVDGTLYALPYALDTQHVIYHPDQAPPQTNSLSQYAQLEVPFLFPAARASGLNSVFLTQYLAANPRAAVGGTLAVDEATLLALFEFYEGAAATELLSNEVVDYSRPTDYRSALTSGEFSSAVVSAQFYLDLTSQDHNFTVAAIPTISGQPTAILDGWMWVMTTNNPSRQELVQAFLEWMMDVDRQGEYVRSLNLLPSQRTALRRWYDEDYVDFLLTILPNATPPYDRAANSASARAVQNALLTVINGEQTAEAATQDVLNQLSD